MAKNKDADQTLEERMLLPMQSFISEVNAMFEPLEVTRGLWSGMFAQEDLYRDCPVDKRVFNDWDHGSICYSIFDNYRANRLCLQFDPFLLMFIDESDLKGLVLVKTKTDVSDQDNDTGVVDEDLYVINYPLLASLDEMVMGFLISNMS